MSKGISPIIATVLLLMMTVAAAGAAFVWMTSLQTQIQQQVENTAGSVTGASNLEFQFRYRKCNSTNTGENGFTHNEVEVILENTGQDSISQGPIGLTLVDDEGNDIEFVQNSNSMSNDFAVDTFLPANFNVSTTLIQGGEYILRISLPGGVTGSQLCVAQ